MRLKNARREDPGVAAVVGEAVEVEVVVAEVAVAEVEVVVAAVHAAGRPFFDSLATRKTFTTFL
jgi:hypothetical protein